MLNFLTLTKFFVGFLVIGLSFGVITMAFEESTNEGPTPMHWSLDKIRMNVIKTADNGVVNHETIFLFSQKEGVVSAGYSGGKISQGFLVGKLSSQNQLMFSYCQMQLDGTLDNGLSTCELSRNEKGKLTLTEHFEWKSRPGEYGTNIFQEL